MDERPGNPECRHEGHWVYNDIVIDTNPPIGHRVCKLCGRLEHVQVGKMICLSPFLGVLRNFEGGLG